MRTALPEGFSGKAEYLVVCLLFTQNSHHTQNGGCAFDPRHVITPSV